MSRASFVQLLFAAILVEVVSGAGQEQAPRHLRGLAEAEKESPVQKGILDLIVKNDDSARLASIAFKKVGPSLKDYFDCTSVNVWKIEHGSFNDMVKFIITFGAKGVVQKLWSPEQMKHALSESLGLEVANVSLTWEMTKPQIDTPTTPQIDTPIMRTPGTPQSEDSGKSQGNPMLLVPGLVVSLLLLVPAILIVVVWSRVRRKSQTRERLGLKDAADMEFKAEEYSEPSTVLGLPQACAEFPEPNPNAVMFQDPRDKRWNVGLIGFYVPGTSEECNPLCDSAFLGNFFYLGMDGIRLEGTCPNTMTFETKTFTNTEAAFHALKFWSQADRFKYLSGEKAVQLASQLHGGEDWKYAGHGSNWLGMLAVLRAKFSQNEHCANALLKTKDAFLLAHNRSVGNDDVWSNNKIGNGTNWLGLQLMLIRDELVAENGGSPTWTQYIQDCGIDLSTGNSRNVYSKDLWQDAVRSATFALVQKQQANGEYVVTGKSFEETQMERHERSLAGASPLDLEITFDGSP